MAKKNLTADANQPEPTENVENVVEASAGIEAENQEQEQSTTEPIVADEPVTEVVGEEEPVAEEVVAEEPAAEEVVAEVVVTEEPVAEVVLEEKTLAETAIAEETVLEEPVSAKTKTKKLIEPVEEEISAETAPEHPEIHGDAALLQEINELEVVAAEAELEEEDEEGVEFHEEIVEKYDEYDREKLVEILTETVK